MTNQTNSNKEHFSKLVYIAGSDLEVSKSIQLLLKTVGVSAKIFRNGESLLNKALVDFPSCIVIDTNLPDVDGLSMMVFLRKQGLNPPIIMLTDNSNVTVAVKAMKAGAWDYFEKPFMQNNLLKSIQYAINKNSGTTGRTHSD